MRDLGEFIHTRRVFSPESIAENPISSDSQRRALLCCSCCCSYVVSGAKVASQVAVAQFDVVRSQENIFRTIVGGTVVIVISTIVSHWCCFCYYLVPAIILRLLLTTMSRDSGTAMKVRKPEPAEIEFKNMRFLITYRPTDATMDRFVEELKKHNVKDVVRVCDPTYNTSRLQQEGITVMDLPFDDGTPPPDDVITEWFSLLRSRFTSDPTCCVAVHCIAGLGRAPVLVALALIELGMKYEDAVELIREKRRGAINAKQLAYLERYHPKSRLKSRSNGHHRGCLLM